MVIAPPMADLRYPPIRWQTVFLSTHPLVSNRRSMSRPCDICATVCRQTTLSRSLIPALQAESFVEFPPMQAPASFNLTNVKDQIVKAIEAAHGGNLYGGN